MSRSSRISPRLLIFGAIALACIGYFVGDYIVVTDEERIEAFAETISGKLDLDRVDAALSYIDVNAVPLNVTSPYGQKVYEQRSRVRSDAHKALSRFYGDHLRISAQEIHVEGSAARLSLRVLTMRGFRDAEFRFRKLRDEVWVLTHLSVR